MTRANGNLIKHLHCQLDLLECADYSAFYTKLYNKLLNGKDDYINDHNEAIKSYIDRIERLRLELSQLEIFKQQLIITTSIMYDGEIVRCIDNYIANIQLRMESLSNTLLHNQSLDIDADYEKQLSLSKSLMDTAICNKERQQQFNKEYLLVEDSLVKLQIGLFGREIWTK